MNKKEICECLVDAGIADERYCRPKDVAQLGNWIMWVHPDYPTEVDCFARYKNPAGGWVISGECYAGIKIEESPFGTKSKAVLKETTAKLNREYRDYLIECDNGEWLHFEDDPKRRFTHQLRAISGDCSAGGMGDTDDILPLLNENLTAFYDYQITEAIFQRQAHVFGVQSEESGKAVRHFYDCAHELERKKVFKHKYHARTSWVLEPFDQWELITNG
jgi:hypothetical protein